MMVDPEELAEQRRAAPAKAEPAPPTDPATAAIAAQVARQDAADRGWRWLCRWRSDRHTFEQIAADEGVQVAVVRAAIDDELRREGTSIVAIEARAQQVRGILRRRQIGVHA